MTLSENLITRDSSKVLYSQENTLSQVTLYNKTKARPNSLKIREKEEKKISPPLIEEP